jgi:hypothetical protein
LLISELAAEAATIIASHTKGALKLVPNAKERFVAFHIVIKFCSHAYSVRGRGDTIGPNKQANT